MYIQQVKKELRCYLHGQTERTAFEERLDKIHAESVLRLEKELLLEDLFLSALIPHLTTIKEQAYSDEELHRLSEALEGKLPFSLPTFARILPHHLSSKDQFVLKAAQSYLQTGNFEGERLFTYQRTEFSAPETLPASISKDLLYLLWMAKKPEQVLSRLGLSEEALQKKIGGLCALLSGEEPAYIRISAADAVLCSL